MDLSFNVLLEALKLTLALESFRKLSELQRELLQLEPASGTAIVNVAEILDNEYDFEGAKEKIDLALKVDA